MTKGIELTTDMETEFWKKTRPNSESLREQAPKAMQKKPQSGKSVSQPRLRRAKDLQLTKPAGPRSARMTESDSKLTDK